MPLPAGTYRLLACGTTSIENNAGAELNNGVDTALDFIIQGSKKKTGSSDWNGSESEAVTLPKTGYAPGVALTLPSQPVTAQCAETNFTLSIPKLVIRMPIVGVPEIPTGWDVSWLGDNIGYLEGTAFPTWNGNSVLAGHVANANGMPGSFAKLSG